ncbi:uroporphyrin-III C tetrapyrrole methyltransferase [Paucilactobacillus vaccinostercus DSM 20634]|jgi:16S rRNA (cytidine1402-2'-O)-methyltransferase|uniref:Ribosomal RNA small subunit methyltransferase I n=1 Tax=Paucilactobacillus vaccinostercus DSM 20634 TaxID=1423813 RepID=A0A0R2A091_9LACO|nr:16S rRNA (cytidine(1402)-2'-O)-methyltransferase [Paucilactobacillus vaccinostercus]KRM60448.1 uroporphyrin-III C tetrapyrrole methyltransferase [Paucilactobacillus vaccinostercus DSM 20634]RRG09183.1 MAG: 16S rRNA (cytidine(1402)-2'-O)-methyltransferase [Lactobacillus sp.]
MQSQKSFEKTATGCLYLVPTPIGNLGDMTYRAVETLKQVDLIASEDTRNTQKLLNHFEIETKQISFHEHNTAQRIPQLIEKMQAGTTIAQVSDAGMPSISDPGKELVAACVAAQIAVVPLPGANAGLTGLIASGLVPQPFYFYGFLDRKNSLQVDELQALKQHQETMIFYEAPHRLKKTISNMASVFGDDHQVVLARELTKKYEEFIRGTLGEIKQWTQDTQIRGEFVIMVAGFDQVLSASPEIALPINEQIDRLIEAGKPVNAAIKEVAKQNGLNRQDVYRDYHEL